ncbi:MAG: sensor histidine kinase, partial [Chloroflexi bacterium]
ELQATQAELAASERRAGVLAERQRLAQEIHDTLAQGFISIIMHLETAVPHLPDTPNITRPITQAQQSARDSLAQARRVVQDLRPEPLEEATLPDAIQQVAAKWKKHGGVETAVSITGDAYPLPPDAEVTLLRAIQEALANIRKHAAANEVRITLSYMADMVVLDVQDNGVGLETNQSPTERNGGYGLTAMRERVAQFNGSVLLESELDEGTTLVVTIPVIGKQ